MVEDRQSLEERWESYDLAAGPGDYRGLTFDDVKHLEQNWPALGRAIHELCAEAQGADNG